MMLHIQPDEPQPRHISTAADIVLAGGVIIYPTDTIYGLGCDIFQPGAIERVCRLKNIEPSKANLSFVCYDLSNLSEFAKQLPTSTFRLLKEYLPGPYTFILPASKQVPRILKSKKNTIGLRIPDNKIARAIVKQVGHPILSTSLPGQTAEEFADPEMIYRNFQNKVDLVIDGGPGGLVPSTVIDFTSADPTITRQGLGVWAN
jgi:tRNA threonylcarbamoyl adenosine modification protein (Sua5/YciO/YrdC/YwlC family)